HHRCPKKTVRAAGATQQRGAAMSALPGLSAVVGVAQACASLGLSRATIYRQRQPRKPTTAVRTPPLKLDAAEQTAVLDALMSPRFVDRAPHQIYATLLDEGRYLCSIRCVFRSMPATSSGACRARIPVHAGPPFRCMPAGVIEAG
ncbi:MAG: hypothetical protein L0H83_11630, partial [Salinisphaera sp.]|nr:hypothetical protein [Salinisphaera sp.]